MKKNVSLNSSKTSMWVATTTDYQKVICSHKNYVVLRQKTAGLKDVVYMKVPPAGKSYIFAN